MHSPTPCGGWKSPVTADLVTGQTLGLTHPQLDGEDTYWIEARPAEAGRNVIVKLDSAGKMTDALPAPLNARSRVHEYGGGAYVVRNGIIFFSNFSDNRVYRLRPGEAPAPLTPEGSFRFADFETDIGRHRLISVRESHSNPDMEPVNEIVSIEMDSPLNVDRLSGGNDFYASPRLSPDGKRLAFLTWNHPNMPWDGCDLCVTELRSDGTFGAIKKIAGGPDESIFQPEWSPAGDLYFASDRTGYWNLYKIQNGETTPVIAKDADFGLPQWIFGFSIYAFTGSNQIICAYCEKGRWTLSVYHQTEKTLTPFTLPHTLFHFVRANETDALILAGTPDEPLTIVKFNVSAKKVQTLRHSTSWFIDPGNLSVPQPLEFPSGKGRIAHGFFYSPKNSACAPMRGEQSPLLVHCHGGPTGMASSVLNPALQFWTSRGFAVLDLNYAGSAGFGRAYRTQLDGAWGETDVDDAVFGARYLVEKGWVDEKRIAIRGGSAGGFTALAALTFRDCFRAAAIYYGISDLEAMAKDTHKFESHYLNRLIGPYPARQDIYLARSPIHHANRLKTPAIFFQGLDDKVVPPSQSEMMVDVLKKKGIPVEYIAFEGEGHGFRRAENQRRALEAELLFYGKIFGFAPNRTDNT